MKFALTLLFASCFSGLCAAQCATCPQPVPVYQAPVLLMPTVKFVPVTPVQYPGHWYYQHAILPYRRGLRYKPGPVVYVPVRAKEFLEDHRND